MRIATWGFGAILALGILAACGKDEPSEAGPTFCAKDNDCRSGAKCIGGLCYSSCTISDDCAEGATCWGGYCCKIVGDCDSPCGLDTWAHVGPSNYSGPGLYCEGDDVFYYETRGCGPCMEGGQCYGERRTACAAGTACRETGAALAECRTWEGAAACAQLQKVQHRQTCTAEGLRACEKYLLGDSCYRLECRDGKWANLDPAGVPCSSLAPTDCDCALDLGFAGARTDGDADSENTEAEGEAVEGDQAESKERK